MFRSVPGGNRTSADLVGSEAAGSPIAARQSLVSRVSTHEPSVGASSLVMDDGAVPVTSCVAVRRELDSDDVECVVDDARCVIPGVV